MTTFLALAVAVAFGVAVYHFSPKEGELPFWPFRDQADESYDNQRLRRDLAAIQAHAAEPGTQATPADEATSDQLSKTGLIEPSERGPLAA